MSLLVVEDVHKVYTAASGVVTALRGVSFSVARGDFLAVRGPSGCGKSTLLHLLGAMDRPTSGRVQFAGRDLGTLGLDELARLRRRQVGFVFQSFNLLPTLTVRENVMLPLTLDGAAERAACRRAAFLLEQVGLADRAEHFPAQLSGGEMQRVAVLRAVAAEPDLLLADEPTGNLDSENGRRVMELLTEMNQRLSLTVILATHSAEAARYAARILYLRDGRIERIACHERVSETV